MGRKLFYDLETTGLLKDDPAIIQIAGVSLDPGEQIGDIAAWKAANPGRVFNQMVRPDVEKVFIEGTDIEDLRSRGLLRRPSELSRVHRAELQGHIRRSAWQAIHKYDRDLGMLFSEALPLPEAKTAFLNWAEAQGASEVSGYNILKFDEDVLRANEINLLPGVPRTDVIDKARGTVKSTKGFSLSEMADAFGIKGSGTLHDAEVDILATAKLDTLLGDASAVQSATRRAMGIVAGERISRKATSQAARIAKAAPFLDRAIGWAGKNPIAAGAVGLAGLMTWGTMAKPLAAIPSGDDSYNTITGLSESGIAAEMRKINTDFGSGYRGLNPSLTVHGQQIPLEVQGFRQAWYSNLGDPEQEAQLKAEIRASQKEYDQFRASDMAAGRSGLMRIHLGSFNVAWDDADTLLLRRKGFINGLFASEIAIRLTGIDAPEMEHPDDPTSWFRFRQNQPFAQEAKAIAEKLTAGKDLELLVDPSASTYGRSLGLLYTKGSDVSINEQLVAMGAAAHLPYGEAGADIYDRAAFQATEEEARMSSRGMWAHPFFQAYGDITSGVGGRITFNTLTDLTRLSRNYNLAAAQQLMHSAEETGSYDPAVARKIGLSLRSSYGRFFRSVKIPRVQGAYYEQEAMGHEGIAWKMRQAMTDFGSKFDMVKNLFKMAGTSFEAGVKSKTFQEALRTGKVLQRLGDESVYGEAFLMESMFGGEKFQYVKKVAKASTSQSDLALRNEAFVLGKIHESPLTPTPYLQEGNELYMELMPGQTVRRLGAAKGTYEVLGKQHAEQMLDTIDTLRRLGISNTDINVGNLLLDEPSGRLSWIDFGVAQATIKEGLEAHESAVAKSMRQALGYASPEVIESMGGQLNTLMRYGLSRNIALSSYEQLLQESAIVNIKGPATSSTGGMDPTPLRALSDANREASAVASISGLVGGRGHIRYTSKSK